ncbi:nucleolar and spindle-associated protein 1 isoform X2 [Salmo salar]|uniref:Nucleolar and spindle-associated protein 1 isoform X2 n=1 Tax=Salmo salar TaxID=8030 RepID=A0A1S3QS48_SALSA|nr:nucleolar and spindle-associated protein 1 isoform X2 [Salmo salar]|eukprot:XP_014042522.1 PREDICTED: nucleolar and spindle-associated protein 1-like isoform X2 [Salmo salar]
MELDSMKYAELRSLAKEVGFKTSKLKADKLLKALKEHFQQQQQQPPQEDVAVDGDETGIAAHDDINSTQEVNNSSQDDDDEPFLKHPAREFVTKRRGRGRPKKRKEPEDEEQMFEKLVEPRISQGSVKRRKTSAAKDSGVAAPVQESQKTNVQTQPEPGHKDAAPAVTFEEGEGQEVVKPVGKIPRHEGLLKRTKSMLKPTTPNFRKLHEAHFKRMESIDSYVERKTKQVDLFRSSVKELKVLSDKTLSKSTEGKPPAISTPSCASLFSPASQRPATDKRRQTRFSAIKCATDKSRFSAGKPATDKHRPTRVSGTNPSQDTVVPFRPTVLSTCRINVRFSQATRDNEHKRSMVKTPARPSTRVELVTPGKETKVVGKRDVNKPSVLSSTKTPGTAFVFNANTSVLSNTPGTNKANFDLKASLSKPLTYKPHRGKLKPYGETKENTADQSQIVPSHQKNYKQHPVQTREERRTKQTEDRKQKKVNMLGARRGLVMT